MAVASLRRARPMFSGTATTQPVMTMVRAVCRPSTRIAPSEMGRSTEMSSTPGPSHPSTSETMNSSPSPSGPLLNARPARRTSVTVMLDHPHDGFAEQAGVGGRADDGHVDLDNGGGDSPPPLGPVGELLGRHLAWAEGHGGRRRCHRTSGRFDGGEVEELLD